MPRKKAKSNNRNQPKARHSDIIWDMPMIQIIMLLLIILSLAIGAAYYAPSVNNEENIAGEAVAGSDAAGVTNTASETPQIACDDGIDNDGDGLIDLEDSQCKNSYDVSESIF